MASGEYPASVQAVANHLQNKKMLKKNNGKNTPRPLQKEQFLRPVFSQGRQNENKTFNVKA